VSTADDAVRATWAQLRKWLDRQLAGPWLKLKFSPVPPPWYPPIADDVLTDKAVAKQTLDRLRELAVANGTASWIAGWSIKAQAFDYGRAIGVWAVDGAGRTRDIAELASGADRP
jgi:hypothetical protein